MTTAGRPNSRLRIERRRRGWTQDDVVERTSRAAIDHGLSVSRGLNANYVSRWERGVTQPDRHHVHLLCLAFELPSDRLGLPGDATPEHLPVLHDVSFDSPSLDGPADQAFIEFVHRSIQQLVLLDNHYGADEIASIAVRLFRSVTHRLTSGLYQPPVERDLVATAGEIGELAGWLLFDADKQDAARRLNQDALYWATLAGDQGMVNFILSNVSLQAIHLQRPLEALHVSQRVREGESGLSSRIRALIHVREGRALALTGQRHDALRDFEEARAFFSDGVRGSDPQWTWWIDDFEITGHEGLCHREAGDARGAAELFHRAIETCPPGRARDRFMYHAHLLRTLADLKDWPQAINVIDRAVPFVGEMASGRVASFLLDATARIRADQSASASVRDGADHLDALLGQAGRTTGPDH
jgi:transcriptional regulator with XRE-family HTH domain